MPMGEITRIASGGLWEPIFGYSRAVAAGGWVMVAGTTGFDEHGTLAGVGQMYVQARQAIMNIAMALERAGSSLGNVVRTRVFVTDITRLNEVARAHKESFGANPPASTVVEVRRLAHPDMLVEIEADAFAGPSREEQSTSTLARAQVRTVRSSTRAKPRAVGKRSAKASAKSNAKSTTTRPRR
jgi:enamine deaminase RidA (YjgF/YER057c/UK114 family)